MSAKQFSPTLNRHDLGDVDGELPHECHDLRLPWKTDLPQKCSSYSDSATMRSYLRERSTSMESSSGDRDRYKSDESLRLR